MYGIVLFRSGQEMRLKTIKERKEILLRTYHMLGTMSCIFTFIISFNPHDNFVRHYSHFAEEKSKAQVREVVKLF